MKKFIVKIEEFDFDRPMYKEAIRKELYCNILSDLENLPNTTESFEQKEYRLEKLRLHLGDFVGLYVDDNSFKIIEKLMALSNKQINIICESRTKKLEERFKEELFYAEKNEEMVKNDIRKLPWYKRLFNNF